jgi:hypothetical protein
MTMEMKTCKVPKNAPPSSNDVRNCCKYLVVGVWTPIDIFFLKYAD